MGSLTTQRVKLNSEFIDSVTSNLNAAPMSPNAVIHGVSFAVAQDNKNKKEGFLGTDRLI